MIVDKICAKCEEKFVVDSEDIPAWQETFLCSLCEDKIEQEMNGCFELMDEMEMESGM